MKIFISVILLNSSLITFGQNDSQSYALPDSIKINIKENNNPPVEVRPDLFIPLSAVNSFSLSLKLGLNPFSPVPDNIADLNNDLYFSKSLLKEQFKSSFLYTMLGAVQAGAVGYLAYKHIKKYGLFK
jgi:hypothetical protein